MQTVNTIAGVPAMMRNGRENMGNFKILVFAIFCFATGFLIPLGCILALYYFWEDYHIKHPVEKTVEKEEKPYDIDEYSSSVLNRHV